MSKASRYRTKREKSSMVRKIWQAGVKHSSDHRIFSWYKVLYELALGPNAKFGTYAGSAPIWVTNRRWAQEDGDTRRRRAIHVIPSVIRETATMEQNPSTLPLEYKSSTHPRTGITKLSAILNVWRFPMQMQHPSVLIIFSMHEHATPFRKRLRQLRSR